MGMAGGLSLPKWVPLAAMRREGERLGYEAEELDDFVEIIMCIDDFHVETETRRIAAEAAAAARRARQPNR